MDLKQSFWRLCSPFLNQEERVEELWEEILGHYSEKGRHYHTLTHVEDLLTQATAFRSTIEDFEVLQFTIWYHDIIYNPMRKDNEWQSALLAEKRLEELNLEPGRIARCKNQILLTQNHQLSDASMDEHYLLDFDLSILGRDWEVYQAYAKKIRKEFKIYPGFLYRKGRKKALKAFLERPRIYSSPDYFEKYESSARANLTKEISQL